MPTFLLKSYYIAKKPQQTVSLFFSRQQMLRRAKTNFHKEFAYDARVQNCLFFSLSLSSPLVVVITAEWPNDRS